MPSLGLEILGVTLALLGWISAIVSCVLPMWRVSAFIGVNIVTAQTTWEGIWMNCVVQSTGQMQCKIHDSMLALSGDLQAARALTVISIVLGILGLLMSVMGAKCTNCVDEETAKARVMIASGGAFILASLTQIIPVSWSAHTIIHEFYSPVIPEQKFFGLYPWSRVFLQVFLHVLPVHMWVLSRYPDLLPVQNHDCYVNLFL
uniref:Claudin 4 n=1 Tax=Cyprinodon variegatus TaxID=28743 RepID=A0A3Q2FQX5_CYPVA